MTREIPKDAIPPHKKKRLSNGKISERFGVAQSTYLTETWTAFTKVFPKLSHLLATIFDWRGNAVSFSKVNEENDKSAGQLRASVSWFRDSYGCHLDLAPEKALPIEDPQLVYQSSLLRSRLLSLEREIAHYRRENDTMRRTRKELEDSKLKLEQEREKFRRYVENEKRRMQLLYSEEQKRIRAEQLKDVANSKGNRFKNLFDFLWLCSEYHLRLEKGA